MAINLGGLGAGKTKKPIGLGMNTMNVSGMDNDVNQTRQNWQNMANINFGKQFNPIQDALNAQYAANVDPLRQETFGTWAERGWGNSGGASSAITQALAGNEAARLKAISDAKGKIQSDIDTANAARAQSDMAKQSLDLQKEAARPTLFGIPL